VILVGEIRDEETAGLAIQAALTGHLVFSTLHTNNAATAIPRLIDMHAEPFLLSSVIRATVAQRICRKICQSCAEQYEPSELVKSDVVAVLGSLYDATKPVMLSRGVGCKECNGNGYLGRIGIYEVLNISDPIAKLITQRVAAGDITKQAVSEGMVTIKQDGYLKALGGITTIEEVLRVAQD
jgi:type IV pilus assembly protein PilB